MLLPPGIVHKELRVNVYKEIEMTVEKITGSKEYSSQSFSSLKLEFCREKIM